MSNLDKALEEMTQYYGEESMKEYTFWYTEEVTYKAGFKAESAEQALELLKGIQSREANVDDLPGFWHKSKDFSVDLSLDTFVVYNLLDGKV